MQGCRSPQALYSSFCQRNNSHKSIMVDRLERRQQSRRDREEEKDSEYRSLSPRGRLRRQSRPDSSLQTLSSQIAFGR